MNRIGSKPWMSGTLGVGDALRMGNKDIEVSSTTRFSNDRLTRYYRKKITSLGNRSQVQQPHALL
jgi:hypothetical protein